MFSHITSSLKERNIAHKIDVIAAEQTATEKQLANVDVVSSISVISVFGSS